jgi:hypothetical protein
MLVVRVRLHIRAEWSARDGRRSPLVAAFLGGSSTLHSERKRQLNVRRSTVENLQPVGSLTPTAA